MAQSAMDMGLLVTVAAWVAVRVTVGVVVPNGFATAVASQLAWYAIMEKRSELGAFRGKERGDVAYIGAMLVFLSAWAMPHGLVAALLLVVPAWFLNLDDRLILPDDSWLKSQLTESLVEQSAPVVDLTDSKSYESTKPRRLVGHEDGLLEFHKDCGPECRTVAAIIDRAERRFSDNDVVGSREVLADGTLGKYVFKSYQELIRLVRNCEDNLSHKLTRVGLYAKNCEEYTVIMLAALHAGITVVPLYDTLGHEAVRHIINHAELTTIFASEENLELVLRLKSPPSFDKSNTSAVCHSLETVYIFNDRTLPADPLRHVNRGPRSVMGLDLRPFEELLEAPAPARSPLLGRRPVEPSDLAFILYTSGTTGVPKGVMLTQGSVVASASALVTTVLVHETDLHLSYLPLAHAFEVAVILAGLMRGAAVGFYHGNVRELTDDAKVLRPTMFIGVPRVFSRVQQVILQQFALKPAPIRRLCYHAVRAQILSVRRTGKRLWFYDMLVFRQVKAALGGRVRIMCTGSAPLAPSIQEFVQVCFDVPTVEGYGLTETSGISNAQLGGKDGVFDNTVGHVGPPLACSEVKLESVPELGYTVQDTPLPRGEVLVRGPNVFKGYYKNPEMTKEVLSSGWFHTGDIGRFNANGTLSIIDRKKNIFKLAQGEYVAPESLETILANVPVVGQIVVHGSSYLPHLVALVVPDPLELVPRLKRGVVPGIPASKLPVLCPQLETWLGDYEALCESAEYGPLIKEFVLAEMTRACKEAELPKFMWPRDILLVSKLNQLLQGLSVENDCLTPTFKVKRKGVQALFGAALAALLESVPEKPTPKTAYPPKSEKR